MDFGALLHVAKKNSETCKTTDGKYYSTKFAPPKKESKDKKLSHNIQKFLAKKEQEEREKLRIEKEKRDALLALRDEKSKNKIRKMLKVIKSANKSVLDDAVDNEHTAISREGGDQPDQDDYGYVSNEANAFYQKYIEKVKDVKEDKHFAPSRPVTRTDLNSTKDRVKAAIEREMAEKNLPQSRVRTSASTGAPKLASALTATSGSLRKKDLYDPEAEKEAEDKKKREEEQQKRLKNKKPPPPAMDFQSLLKLAEKKQFEPVVVEVEPKKKEPERLLTKKEKQEMEERQRFMEERERRKKEMEKNGGKSSATTKPKVPERQKMEPNGRIPKLNQSPASKSTSSTAVSSLGKSSDPKSAAAFKKPLNPVSASPNSSIKNINASSTKPSSSPGLARNSNTGGRPLTNGGSSSSKDKQILKASSSAKPISAPGSSKTNLTAPISRSSSNQNGGKPSYSGPTRDFPPKDIKSRSQVPEKTRQFPPPDVRRSNKIPERKPQQAVKRRIYDDDEDEYDSDLDDFIDDGPDEEDYSQHIKAIFGYDKSRYRDIDEDDSGMESSFAQQMREEYVSKKIGLMEDLEDMRQEAEEKKRKAMTKKKKVH